MKMGMYFKAPPDQWLPLAQYFRYRRPSHFS